MERQVQFRDRQELQAQDLANIQSFVAASMGHFVTDAITAEKMVYGLVPTIKSASEVSVSIGRLFDGTTGAVYTLDQPQTLSVQTYMPVVDSRWLVLSVTGVEEELDQQPRDYCVDLATGQTEPQVVAMELARRVQITITAGIESADPQKPAVPTGYTLIGYVLLSNASIQEVQTSDVNSLPNLFLESLKTFALEEWRDRTEPRLLSIETDIAANAAEIERRATKSALAATNQELSRTRQRLAQDEGEIARLRENAGLPDTLSVMGGDKFLDSAETDADYAGYSARVDEGVRFPLDNKTEQVLALMDPHEPDVINHDGFILPAYSHVQRLAVTGHDGVVAINQYQTQTTQMRHGVRSEVRRRYGPTRTVCTNSGWHIGGTYDPQAQVFKKDGRTYEVEHVQDNGPGHQIYRVREYWEDRDEDHYWYPVETTDSVNGSVLAQSFLNSQYGYLTRIGLFFDSVAGSGDVTVAVVETTDSGAPNPQRLLGKSTVAVGDLKRYPGATTFGFTQPILLSPGKHYAMMIISTGDHKIVTVDGNDFTHGTLFYGTDGAYFAGDLTKDVAFTLTYAKFHASRIEVELTTISLSGGIADLDLLTSAALPSKLTSFVLEYKAEGSSTWYPMSAGTAEQLRALPVMLHLRAVLSGTRDLMPGIGLADSRLTASRPATALKHASTVRGLPGASSDVEVTFLLEGWDAIKHSFTAKLDCGGVIVEAAAVQDTELPEPNTIQRRVRFTPAAVANYQIIAEGTTTDALDLFHVAERWDVAR